MGFASTRIAVADAACACRVGVTTAGTSAEQRPSATGSRYRRRGQRGEGNGETRRIKA